MTHLAVRNWDEFQHYRDRDPLWIKIYGRLLDDAEFLALPEAAQAQLVKLWLLASRCKNRIHDNRSFLRHALHTNRLYINELLAARFIERVDATAPAEDTRADWASRYIKPEVRKRVIASTNGRCALCGDTEHLEVDHIIPISKGGTGDEANLQPLCRRCNRRKRVSVEQPATQNPNSATQVDEPFADLRSPHARPRGRERRGELETEKETPTPTARVRFFDSYHTDPRLEAFRLAIGPAKQKAWGAILDQWVEGDRFPLGLRPTADQILDSLAAAVTASDGGPLSERFVIRCVESTVNRKPMEQPAASSFAELYRAEQQQPQKVH